MTIKAMSDAAGVSVSPAFPWGNKRIPSVRIEKAGNEFFQFREEDSDRPGD